jgi:Flp pilus assembly protein TadD
VDRIIRTCRAAALAAALAALLAGPAAAARSTASTGADAWRAFLRGRLAASDGRMEEAASAYATALAADPGDALLQRRAFALALAAGDNPLATSLAQKLENAGQGTAESRLLLFGEAVARRDWKRATALQAIIAQDRIYQFIAPMLADWIAVGQKRDPLAAPEPTRIGPSERAYADEQRAYLLNALGRTDQALTSYSAQFNDKSGRATRLRIAAAAMLVKAGRQADALTVLAGDEETLAAARALVTARRPLPGAVDTSTAGIAELLARFAADLSRQQVPELPLLLARISNFLAPANAEGWIITAQVLWEGGKPEAALAALGNVRAGDPFESQVGVQRIGLLLQLERKDQALALLTAAANAPDARAEQWSRLADLYSSLNRYPEAVAAYDRAIALSPGDGRLPLWTLYMLKGAALERGKDWPAAEAALRKAVQLAPREPAALNYLGYAQLDRGVNLAEATKLIEQASALAPDDAAITDSLGWAYYRSGDYARAVPTLERAAASRQSESTINEHLGDAYWQVGRKIEARFAWRAALADSEEAVEQARLRAKIDFGPDAAATARP